MKPTKKYSFGGKLFRIVLVVAIPLIAVGILTANNKPTSQTTVAKKKFTVVIDPGHGGYDPGAERSQIPFLHEKDICLHIARKLTVYLEERLENVIVIPTRDSDMFVSLEKRVEIAETANADLFVSLHCNSHPIKSIQGVQIHIHEHGLKNSLRFANILQQEFAQRARRKTYKIQTATDRKHNLYVLQNTSMPAALIELGFLSNPEEEAYLNSPLGQDLLASAIFRAIRTYRAQVESQ
jgi:N-acetylmuramoyl-L-alanine amidase